jgi:hypothetical protein
MLDDSIYVELCDADGRSDGVSDKEEVSDTEEVSDSDAELLIVSVIV